MRLARGVYFTACPGLDYGWAIGLVGCATKPSAHDHNTARWHTVDLDIEGAAKNLSVISPPITEGV